MDVEWLLKIQLVPLRFDRCPSIHLVDHVGPLWPPRTLMSTQMFARLSTFLRFRDGEILIDIILMER